MKTDSKAESNHRYNLDDDRCKCGGNEVYFDYRPRGYGCESEGKPWSDRKRSIYGPLERQIYETFFD